MSKIIQALKKAAPLKEEDCRRLLNLTSTIQLEKSDYWIQPGRKNNNIAFLDNGYLRKFYAKDGNEITDSFYFENDFCTDLPSIIGNSPPHASIIAMQKTSLTIFSYNEFNELCKASPALEHLFRVMIEFTFLRFYNRTVSFILQTPKERYEQLLVSSPKILQDAAQYHIASYLGISPQHLSRLRAKK
jgi:CRP-like cAMP-binding protein